jgi:diguanylate cyclase
MDTLGRLGGDEFAVVMPSTDAGTAATVGQRLLDALRVPIDVEEHQIRVRASVGLAAAPEHGTDGETLLRRADAAMYRAKAVGGGLVGYAPEQEREIAERLILVQDLRDALLTGGLELQYQPKLDFRSGQLEGVEALLRWPHPQRGQIPPDRFIPLAEQTGLIGDLTAWVLDAALGQCRAWLEAGLRVPIAVNLSARDLRNRALPATIAQLLRDRDVAGELLTVEVTESAILDDEEAAHEVLMQIRRLGVRVSLDDFGTGYSSLGRLLRLPVDELKIDRGFVRRLTTDAVAAAIVRCSIDLGHALGQRVVAEGVEDTATSDALRILGCDVAQGYLLGRPMTVEEADMWLRSRAHLDQA